MRTTIDKAGRLVIPKALRDGVGLVPGEVEITIDGAVLRVEPVSTGRPVQVDGVLTLPETGRTLTAEDVRALRLADQP